MIMVYGAGAVKANLLADFAQAVTACVAQGKSLEWFQANFDSIVEKHGWAYKGPARLAYPCHLPDEYAHQLCRPDAWLSFVIAFIGIRILLYTPAPP